MQQRPQITDTLMDMLDSFFLTLTCHGHILLISSSIEQHLGHCQSDLYGQSIMQITHPEDQNMLKQQLIPTELENLFDAHGDADAEGEPRQRSKTEEDAIDRKLREDRRSFRVRWVQVTSYHNLLYHYLSYHNLYLTLSYHIILSPIISYHNLDLTLSYHIILYDIIITS